MTHNAVFDEKTIDLLIEEQGIIPDKVINASLNILNLILNDIKKYESE